MILQKIEPIESSYAQHNYGKTFYYIVRSHRPTVVVEIGTLHGYSAIHIGMSLKHNEKLYGYGGTIECYDLWDQYKFNHGNKIAVQDRINKYDLQKYVTLKDGNADNIHENFDINSVHLLHVDISNDGDVVDRMMELWHPIIVMQGMIIFEGGDPDRDKVDWMIKYNKRPIAPVIAKNKLIQSFYLYGTYNKFPSLTVLVKKGD